MKKYHFKALIVWLSLCFCQLSMAQTKQVFDIVLLGGRVIDPETKLDAIRNIGILNGRIASISTNVLVGFPTGTSVIINRFYADIGGTGFVYQITQSTSPGSPAVLLTLPSTTTCNGACIL
jgi:hypothetical protein